ncbi:MAG: LPD38 domain-containing protein, partial [Flavobacteriaceae bacterium]
MSEEALAEFVTGFGQSITQQAAQNGIDAVDYAQVLKDAIESASLGAFGGGTIRTVGYVPSTVAMANSIGVKNSKIKNRKAIEELSQKLETAETEVERTAIVELLDKAIQNDAKDVNRSVKVYELMKNESQQDFDYVYQLDASLRRKISQYEATEDTDIKKALGEDIKRLSGLKEQIENKYDRKEEVGVPSGVREGEAVVAAEPVVREGEKAPEAGRVLQVPAEEVTQEIYNEFVDKGVVPDGAIVSISDKIVSGETLTEQEQAIYKDKSGQIEEQVRLKREQFMTPEEIEAERLRAEKEAPKVEAVKPEDLPVESTSREFIKVVEEQLPTPTQGKFGGYPIMAAGYKKGDELNYKPIKEGGNVLAEVGLQAVSPDVVEVSEFVSIPTLLKEERTGAGTKALKQLTDFADKAGVTLRLTPSPLKQVAPVEGMDTQEALIKFYEEKGGFELREDGFMYYEPKKAAPKAKPAPKKEAKPKAKKAVAGAPAYATNKQSLEKILERQPNITKEQAKATASVMDVMIGKMAEREGISKAQMYDKIGFVKGELPVDKLKAALKQDPNSGYYSNAQEALQRIDQNKKATPKEWVSLLEKTGIPAIQQQLNNIGFLEFFEAYTEGENLKTITYQDVKDYLDMYDFDMYEKYTDKYASGYMPEIGLTPEESFQKNSSFDNRYYNLQEQGIYNYLNEESLKSAMLSKRNRKNIIRKVFERHAVHSINPKNYKKPSWIEIVKSTIDFLMNPNDPIVKEASEQTIGGYQALVDLVRPKIIELGEVYGPTVEGSNISRIQNFLLSKEKVKFLDDVLSRYSDKTKTKEEFLIGEIAFLQSEEIRNQTFAGILTGTKIDKYAIEIAEDIAEFRGFLESVSDFVETTLNQSLIDSIAEWGEVSGRTVLFKSDLLGSAQANEEAGYSPPHFGYDDIFHVRMRDVAMRSPETAAVDSDGNILDGRGVLLAEVQSDLMQYSKNTLGEKPDAIKKEIKDVENLGLLKYTDEKIRPLAVIKSIGDSLAGTIYNFFDGNLDDITKYADGLLSRVKKHKEAIQTDIDYAKSVIDSFARAGISDIAGDAENTVDQLEETIEKSINPLIQKLTDISANATTGEYSAEELTKELSFAYLDIATKLWQAPPSGFERYLRESIANASTPSVRDVSSGISRLLLYKGELSPRKVTQAISYSGALDILNFRFVAGDFGANLMDWFKKEKELYNRNGKKLQDQIKKFGPKLLSPFTKTEQPLKLALRRALKDAASKQVAFPDKPVYLILPSGTSVNYAVAGGANQSLENYYDTTVPSTLRDVLKKIDKDAQVKDGSSVSLQFGEVDPQNKVADFKYVEITPKIVQAFVNKPIALFQDYKGAMVEDDAKYLIYLMENADVSTPLHEMAHVYEKFLTDEEKAEILKWAGNKQWSRETSEKFARGFEKYLASGTAPQLWLQKIFNKFKMWLVDIYNGVKGSKIDLELSPAMVKIYDSIFLQDKTFEFRRPTQLQGTMDLWIQGLQQKFIGVLRLQEQVENSIGKAVAIGQDFRNAFRLVNGKIADKFDKLKEKYEETALSMKKLKVSQEDLHLFLYANTAAERNAFVKENRDPMNSSGSGMTDVAAERILNEFEEKNLTGKLKESAKSIYDITKDTRKKLVEYGLESQGTIDKYEQNFKNYVPLRGFETTGEEDFESIPGFSQRQVKGKRKLFKKKIKGRTTLAGDIIYQVIADNYETIVRGEKNLVLQRLYKFAEEYRDNNVWETLTPKQVGSKKPTKFEAIPVFFNGEAHYIKMRDQRMNEIINESSYESASKLLTFFSAINRFASMMFTTYSPEFWITNFGRDLQAAVFNVLAEQEIEDGLLVGKKILKGIAQESLLSLRTIFAVETTGKSKLKETAKYYEEFKEDGAPTAWIENLHPDKIKNAFDQIAELSDAGTASLMSKKQLSVAANKVSEYVLSVNSAFENAIRLAVYIKARKAGVSREKAAETAKTITIDFNASGTWSRGFNAAYLFFNAATQNVARLVRTLGTLKTVVDPVTGKKKKTTTGAQKLAFGIIGFGYLVTQLNIAFSGDDEDELEKYMDVPDYEKTRNIIFYPPKSFRKYLMSLTDEEGYIKLPTTYGYNMFFNFGVAMAELQSGQRSPASAAAFAFNSFIDGILPIQVQTSDKSTLNGFVKTFAPSATKPFIEVLTNEAYNGSPVYREGFPTDKTPRSYKGFERSFTEKSMSEITKTLNDISGGSEYVSGGIDWNPDATVYILNYFGGGPLTFAEKTVNSVDIAYRKAMGESQDVNPNDIPILRRFLGSTNPYGDYETYYERKEEITSLFKEMSDPKAKKDDPDRYKGVDQLYVLLYGVTGS